MTGLRTAGLLAAVAMTAIVGCGGPSSAPADQSSGTVAASGPVQGPAITITALSFGDPLTVPPGAQVTVVNTDEVAHTVTAKAKGQFDVRVAGNARATFTAPAQPGEYPYYCVYHPGMVGLLVVK